MSARVRHSGVRQATVPPTPARGIAKDLPPYEPPAFALNPNAQRALAQLTQDLKLKKLDQSFQEAQEALSFAVGEINDRVGSKEKAAKLRKAKQQKNGTNEDAEGAADDGELSLAELREKVDKMTQRMDDSMRKIIDGRHSVLSMKDALAATAEDARANASTQASTQQVRSQRRPARGSESGEDDEDEEEYQEFEPTDPAAGTQVQSSAVDVFKAKMEDAKTRYQSHSLAARYAENNDYVNFRKVVHDARYPDDDVPMPHASEWFPEADGPAPGITTRARANADEEDDDDIAISRATISTKCPLTLQEFKEPLTSTRCPHSFESQAIVSMIALSNARKNGERAVQCPVSGCAEMLTKADLQTDTVLLRKIKRIQRAKQLQEEEALDDEDGDGSGQTQRDATLIDDDEDGADVDTVIERQTQLKNEPKPSGVRPASTAPRSTAPQSTAPIELGSEDEEEDAEEADDSTQME